MSLLNNEMVGAEVLRTPAVEVGEVDDDLRRLIDDMFETMYAAKGIGLAGPQVGVGRRVIVVDVNDEGGEVNATLVSLLASCGLHRLEPLSYLRDMLCLLPSWSQLDLLALAPLNWSATVARTDVRQRLEENQFRSAALGVLKPGEQALATAV